MLDIVKRSIRKIAVQVASFLNGQGQFAETNDLIAKGLLVIGRHSYGSPKVWMYRGSECKVIIGNFGSIGPGVQFIAGGIHPPSWVSTYPFRIKWKMNGAYDDGMPETRGDIIIGSDVWLGTDVVVLSGLNIGHGAIVATRSVVTHSIPPYAIVAGSPARIVKYRFDADIVDRLIKIAWWEWDDEKIHEAVPLLSSGNMDQFLLRYDEITKE
jgi:chloramphenicol O-acetyltransferase type B